MTATLTFGPPEAAVGRATFAALAAQETRRLVLNPVFLFAVAITAWTTWAGAGTTAADIDTVNSYPAIFLGGFGMMATFWLTRSMRASEPVVGVTPVTRPARTAALCWVAVVPFLCGVLTLFVFLRAYPVGEAAQLAGGERGEHAAAGDRFRAGGREAGGHDAPSLAGAGSGDPPRSSR